MHRLSRTFRSALLFATVAFTNAFAQSTAAKLTAYFVDVEGGQASLFISASGESLLIDTGWAGNNFRDADRIATLAHQAGLTRIDFVLITHYHADHVGGVPQLVARIPIGAFIDHGPNREIDHAGIDAGYAAYLKVIASTGARHITAHPGEHLPIPGFDTTVISADGDLIDAALPGAGQANPFCNAADVQLPPDTTENARSVGILMRIGPVKLLDLGDLTRDKEQRLMCPLNKLGPIDILVVSHHGSEQSSSRQLVHAVHPRIAIMDNGATKGGSAAVLQTIAKSPDLESMWQLHFSEGGGAANNTAEKYIANPAGPDSGNYLMLTINPSNSFEVANSRNGFARTYEASR